MPGADMVHLRTVNTAFHARVIAARLGADGIPTQLLGNLDGPYPLGDVSVWVSQEDAESARELLLADEVEAAFDLPDEGEPWEDRARRPMLLGLNRMQLLAAFGIAVLLSAAMARILA
jgi:Putative prokaryotic signal transducing protein